MRKYIVLLLSFLLIFISTAGCIDIHLFRDLFAQKKEKKTDYWINEFNVAHHNFTSFPPDQIIETYNDQFEVKVKPLTKSMRFDIRVEMTSAEGVWEPIKDILNGTPFGEIIDEIIKMAAQRYVEVTITSPEDVELLNYKFNQTGEEEVMILGPAEGAWIIDVEGAGAGLTSEQFGFEYHDSFTIDAIINEPVGEKT